MPVNLQSLQSFAGITDISRFKVGADNQLETRSAAGAFFRRVGDAFLRLSQSGRASIAARNEKVMKAVTAAVNDARSHAEPEVRTLGERLQASATQLKQVVGRNKSAVLTDMVHKLCSGRAYSRLPAQYQALMRTGLVSIANNLPVAQWKDNMESLRDTFLKTSAEPGNKAEGCKQFGKTMKDCFITPGQQSNVSEDGIHRSFFLDTRRRNIDSIGGEVMPQVMNDNADGAHEPGKLTPDELAQHCEARLRALVGEEHQNLMPFISMMASQAGIDSATSFLPSVLKAGMPDNLHLTAAGIMLGRNDHTLRIDRQGDDLILQATFRSDFINSAVPSDETVLSQDGTVSMRINLAAPPETTTVTIPATQDTPEQQREVLIPQFTVENADVNYHLGGNPAV